MSANHANADELPLDLSALAVEERLLAEWRLGNRSRLGDYVRRYPAQAGALAALVASLEPDAGAALERDAGAESPRMRAWVMEGEQRALATLLSDTPANAHEYGGLRVAEERSAYVTEATVDADLSREDGDVPGDD